MKRGLLVLLLFSTVISKSQSLKDALFSGKLKNQPGTVIHKGDDLSTKIDTSTHKNETDVNINPKLENQIRNDSIAKSTSLSADSSIQSQSEKQATLVPGSNTNSSASPEAAPIEKTNTVKDNNFIWKKFMDSVNTEIKTEVLNSKKLKKGTYYILLSYNIGTDGQVSIVDVAVTPDNTYLKQAIKDRISVDTPQLNPVLNSTGAPRKVTKRYSFTISKV